MFRRTTITPTTAWGALLVTWSGLTVSGGLFVDSGETRILLPLLSALVNAIGLWRPLPNSGVMAGVLCGALFVAARIVVDGPLGVLATAAISPLGLIGAGFLADALSRQSEAEADRHRQDAQLIEELTPTLGESGALKWGHALRLLADELTRARRYKYPVALALVEIGELQGPGVEEPGVTPEALEGLMRVTAAAVRGMDRFAAYREDMLAVLLPHTSLDGALIFLDKLRAQGETETGLPLRAGVAEFPADAASPEDLVREAEAALEFARESSLSVVSRGLLCGAEGGLKGASAAD